VLPHNLEAERAVLGALALWHEGIVDVADDLTPDDFYAEGHQAIYGAILALYHQKRPTDYVTIEDMLERQGVCAQMGGRGALARMAAATPTALHLRYYAAIVIHLAQLRRLFEAGQATMADAFDDAAEGGAVALIERAEERLAALALRGGGRVGVRGMEDIVSSYLSQLEDLADGRSSGITSGFYDLDAILGGFQRSDLVVLAARPSVGKTALAVCLMRNVLLGGGRVALFSLEMSHEQIMQRLICVDGQLDSRRLRTGTLDGADWQTVMASAARFNDLDLVVDGSTSPSMAEIAATCRRMHARKPLDLVVVDYLQLVHGSSDAENRVQEVGGVSRDLKSLAREVDAPVLALSQLSRSVDSRADHRPVLSDLRDSGEIEQNADVVLFLYRDEVYNRDTERPFEAELIVAKHRNGPTGFVPLFWCGAQTRFASIERSAPRA